jgi:hypothetical protein
VSVLGKDFQNPQKQDVFAGASTDGFTAFLKILAEDGHGNEAAEFEIGSKHSAGHQNDTTHSERSL